MSWMIAGMTATPMRHGAAPRRRSRRATGCARVAPAITSPGSPCRAAPRPEPNGDAADAAGAEHVGVGEQHLGGDAFLVEHGVARVRVVGRGQAAVAAGLLVPLASKSSLSVIDAIAWRSSSISRWCSSNARGSSGSR